MIAAILLLAVNAPISGCDLADIKTARSLHEALGRRAAKIIAAASAAGPNADALLDGLIDQSASFALGAGDVGRPLGTGVAGARSLAETMNADQFRFLGWDYMHSPADACGKQSIKVDFISSTDRRISQVEFTFQQARLIAAKGGSARTRLGHCPSRLLLGKAANHQVRPFRFRPIAVIDRLVSSLQNCGCVWAAVLCG